MKLQSKKSKQVASYYSKVLEKPFVFIAPSFSTLGPLSLSLSLSLSKSKQFFMFNYCLRICLFVSFIFLIILTKVHISLYLCEFPFCFDSLIWNTDAFMSIQEFCNFNNLIFIPFYHHCLMFMCISTSYKLIYYKSWVLKLVDAYTNNTFSFLKACNNDTCHFFFFCFILEMN